MKTLLITFTATIVLLLISNTTYADQQQQATSVAVSRTASQAISAPTVYGGGESLSSVNISSEGTKIPAPLPSINLPGVPVPQIFFGTDKRPANEVAFYITMLYNQVFPQVYSLEGSSPSTTSDGESGETVIIFNQHSTYVDTGIPMSISTNVSTNCIEENPDAIYWGLKELLWGYFC